jgi:hypothetical protein
MPEVTDPRKDEVNSASGNDVRPPGPWRFVGSESVRGVEGTLFVCTVWAVGWGLCWESRLASYYW